MATAMEQFAGALTANAADFGVEISDAQVHSLKSYYGLLLKWNPRLHLVAPCSPAEFAIRHVLEALLLLQHVPLNASVVDIGSGGGLPIVPCLLMRRDLRAILVESSQKKAVFLREALRAVKPVTRAEVIVSRFEEIEPPDASFLTCRALDRFSTLLPNLVRWARPETTFLLFAGTSLRDRLQSLLSFVTVERIPQSARRFLIIGRRGA